LAGGVERRGAGRAAGVTRAVSMGRGRRPDRAWAHAQRGGGWGRGGRRRPEEVRHSRPPASDRVRGRWGSRLLRGASARQPAVWGPDQHQFAAGTWTSAPDSPTSSRPTGPISRPGTMPPVAPRKRAGRLPWFRGAGRRSCRSVQYRSSGDGLGPDYRISGDGFTVVPGMVWAPTTVFPGMVYRSSGDGSRSQVARSLDLRLPCSEEL